MTTQDNRWIIYDGKLRPAEEPVANATSRGLMYGDGLFETIRVYEGQTLFFENHVDRLAAGLHTLGMDIAQLPEPGKIRDQIRRLLRKNQLLNRDAIVRLQFWREGERGYNPQSSAVIRYTATASGCPDYRETSARLATVSTRRIPSESLPSGGKFTNGINYILAAQEAAAQDADDALMQTVDGWISETTIANIFWISRGQIYTPSTDCDLIPGITRQALIEIIGRHSTFKVREDRYSIETLYEAEAVGLCNSVREITAVLQVDDHEFSRDHPVLNELQQLYSDFRNQNLKALPDIE